MRFESKKGQHEKNEEKHVLQLEKNIFSLLLFFCHTPVALHFQGDLKGLRRHSYNILNHSK
jgi:hypothetical protein